MRIEKARLTPAFFTSTIPEVKPGSISVFRDL